jgi:sugar phosphate isomerase/epimerase
MPSRRDFLALAAGAAAAQPAPGLTRFQIGCMTLPYSPFPLERALTGIKSAGYRYVAWGTSHERKPILAVDDPPSRAAELAAHTRGLGLEPVMMFATVVLEEPTSADGHISRIKQAAAARIPYVLTFGRTRPGEYENVIRALKTMGPVARDNNVTVLIKQHGGNTATGSDCSKILREVGDPGIAMCYDAGNVLDYESRDPLPDIKECWSDVRAFAIKDHRDTPKDQDCGPGFGEIDHYKLLMPVARTGRDMPLVCENIFEPLVPRPSNPDGVDALARRAREFLETVTRGIQT